MKRAQRPQNMFLFDPDFRYRLDEDNQDLEQTNTNQNTGHETQTHRKYRYSNELIILRNHYTCSQYFYIISIIKFLDSSHHPMETIHRIVKTLFKSRQSPKIRHWEMNIVKLLGIPGLKHLIRNVLLEM